MLSPADYLAVWCVDTAGLCVPRNTKSWKILYNNSLSWGKCNTKRGVNEKFQSVCVWWRLGLFSVYVQPPWMKLNAKEFWPFRCKDKFKPQTQLLHFQEFLCCKCFRTTISLNGNTYLLSFSHLIVQDESVQLWGQFTHCSHCTKSVRVTCSPPCLWWRCVSKITTFLEVENLQSYFVTLYQLLFQTFQLRIHYLISGCGQWMLINALYPAKHGAPIYTKIGQFCVFHCDYALSPARPLSGDSQLKGILWVSHNKTRHWPHSQPFPALSDEPHFCSVRIFKRRKKSFFALALAPTVDLFGILICMQME